jgi:UDP-N-acetylmuramate dehydrogenase
LHFSLMQKCSLAEAKSSPQSPFLQWHISVPSSEVENLFSLEPQEKPGRFLEGLWSFSVSELFLAHPHWHTKTHELKFPYLEFEVTPQLHWLALDFEDVRKRTAENQTALENLWQGTKVFSQVRDQRTEFGMLIPYKIISGVVDTEPHASKTSKSTILVQGALSLGLSRYFLAPHWSKAGNGCETSGCETWCYGVPPQVKPDFHQPHRFQRVILT